MKTLGRTTMVLDADNYLDIILVKSDNDYVVWYQNMDDQKREGREYAGCYQGSYFNTKYYGDDDMRKNAYTEYTARITEMMRRSGCVIANEKGN